MARLERTLYRAGVGPSEYHALSLRRAFQVARSEVERNQQQWRHTSFLGALIVNNAGFGAPDTPVKPWDIAPHAFPNEERIMSKDRMKENLKRHEKRLEREQSDGRGSSE